MFSFCIQKCQSDYEEWLLQMMRMKEQKKKIFQRVSIFGWKNFFFFQKHPTNSAALVSCSKECPPDCKLRCSFQQDVLFSWSHFRRVLCHSRSAFELAESKQTRGVCCRCACSLRASLEHDVCWAQLLYKQEILLACVGLLVYTWRFVAGERRELFSPPLGDVIVFFSYPPN